MSDDGANLGVSADRALATVLGGKEQPTEEEHRDPKQMEEYLLSAGGEIGGYEEGGSGYGDAARLLGRYILEFMLRHPGSGLLPASPEFDTEHPEYRQWLHVGGPYPQAALKQQDFGSFWKETEPENYREAMDKIGPSGFQFGWALNAARYCCELPPVPNPAILTIG